MSAPAHYTDRVPGVECIDVTKHFSFCLGNVIKYVWRAGVKSEDPVQDLEKARTYLDFEISRLTAERQEEDRPVVVTDREGERWRRFGYLSTLYFNDAHPESMLTWSELEALV